MKLMDEYKRKCVSADEAVKVIQSGDWVEFAWAGSHAALLGDAIDRRREELTNVNFRGGVILKPLPFIENDPNQDHFTWNSAHMSGYERKLAQKNMAYYLPIKYSEYPRYIRENCQTDVVAIQTTPMDDHGYFNFGVTVSHYAAAIDMARNVIIEVNEDMPRVHGGYDHHIHISQVDYIVEGGKQGMPILPSAAPSEIDKKIAGFVLEEITDGCCIQLGIGGMPNALGQMLAESDLKDLGINTEMLVDGFVDMFNAGKVTGIYKEIDRGRMAWSFAAGTQKLYDFMHDNPGLAAFPVDYTNHPCSASRISNLISINSAVEIDLSGQVCSESAGPYIISGQGGQLDFVEAAYNSKGGKTFICLSSTYTDKDGKVHSRINGMVKRGAIITDTRPNVQFVVTEYGKVNLKGKTSWQRAEALISIAHPDFRESLIEEAKELRIWRKK
ncbi:MAG: acetyl-CoA hydrolase/transferase C-terminal domain-containing protein [Anaerovoracaceae bacterium]|jgi:butyryl-CoA:acetate CoA-transferase